MKWEAFLTEFAERPLFHSSMLDIFPDHRHHIQVQLARWVKAGKLSKIRRGWYLIRKPYRLREVPIPAVATTVVHPSYLSLEWALQYYEMIPESVPNPTCVTTDRTVRFAAQNRLFIYHHIQTPFFTGYMQEEWEGHDIFIARPEKALLDKIYLYAKKNRFSLEWLRELRLHNLDRFDREAFKALSQRVKLKGFSNAVALTIQYIKEETA